MRQILQAYILPEEVNQLRAQGVVLLHAGHVELELRLLRDQSSPPASFVPPRPERDP